MPNKTKLPASWRCLLALVLGGLMGGGMRRWLYSGLLGYCIHPTASIGISYVRVANANFDPKCRLGHFTIIRNLQFLELGENARIGTFNWVFGMFDGVVRYLPEEENRVSKFVLEKESSLTSRHIVDCSNQVTIGAFSTVAGFNSQILTHGIDLDKSRQSTEPVVIGRYCLIGTGCIILKGTVIPDYSVVGAGSVFRGQPGMPYHLYSGVPTAPVKHLSQELGYFVREEGRVS